MSILATTPDPTPVLTQLHVHSSLRRAGISRGHISDLEDLIQSTLIAIARSRSLIARSDDVCDRVWGTKVGPRHQDRS
jgi:hypothetical protein